MQMATAEPEHCHRIKHLESSVQDGIEYCLYDTVMLYRAGEAESYVGMIVRMFETVDHVKKVKIVWFFRPSDIRNFLGDYSPKWNELFLASGKGRGISNINPLEAVLRKCNVLCTSSDPRNSSSRADLRRADFIFRMTFDVAELKLSAKFPDKIDGVIVEKFFNSSKYQIGNLSKESSFQRNAKREYSKCFPASVASEEQLCKKKMKLKDEETKSSPQKERFKNLEEVKERMVKLEDPLKNRDFSMLTTPMDNRKWFKEPETVSFHLQDNSKWFKEPETSWKERLQTAQNEGALVLLENLDPSCTSSEVEEIILSAMKEKVRAKMIPRTAYWPRLYGKAFVIFNSMDAAKTAIRRLNEQCLIMSDQRISGSATDMTCRPIVARRGVLKQPGRSAYEFPGHYSIRPRRRMYEHMRIAIATGHPSQENTIEYVMALEWWVQQAKAETSTMALCKRQEKEIRTLTGWLKIE